MEPNGNRFCYICDRLLPIELPLKNTLPDDARGIRNDLDIGTLRSLQDEVTKHKLALGIPPIVQLHPLALQVLGSLRLDKGRRSMIPPSEVIRDCHDCQHGDYPQPPGHDKFLIPSVHFSLG